MARLLDEGGQGHEPAQPLGLVIERHLVPAQPCNPRSLHPAGSGTHHHDLLLPLRRGEILTIPNLVLVPHEGIPPALDGNIEQECRDAVHAPGTGADVSDPSLLELLRVGRVDHQVPSHPDQINPILVDGPGRALVGVPVR